MSNSSPVTDAAHATPPPGSGPRPGLPLDDAGWRWTAGRVPPSKPGGACSGIAVRLPHCWNAHEEFIRGGGILPGISDPDFHLYGGMGGGMTWVSLPRVRLVRNACRIIVDEADPDGVLAELDMKIRSLA